MVRMIHPLGYWWRRRAAIRLAERQKANRERRAIVELSETTKTKIDYNDLFFPGYKSDYKEH